MSDFVKNIRFISAGQDDPQSVALSACADRIEALEEALRSIAKVPRSEAAYGIIQVFVKYALEGEDG